MFAIPTAFLDQELVHRTRSLVAEKILAADTGRVQRSDATQRRTHEYGYRYANMLNGDFSYVEVPDFLPSLYSHAVDKLRHITDEDLPVAFSRHNCIVSTYGVDYKLQAHVDVDERRLLTSDGKKPDFHFSDIIIGVVLKADSEGCLYFHNATSREELAANGPPAHPLDEIDGLAYMLRGPHRSLMHGVSTVKNERLSVTFRTVEFG